MQTPSNRLIMPARGMALPRLSGQSQSISDACHMPVKKTCRVSALFLSTSSRRSKLLIKGEGIPRPDQALGGGRWSTPVAKVGRVAWVGGGSRDSSLPSDGCFLCFLSNRGNEITLLVGGHPASQRTKTGKRKKIRHGWLWENEQRECSGLPNLKEAREEQGPKHQREITGITTSFCIDILGGLRLDGSG